MRTNADNYAQSKPSDSKSQPMQMIETLEQLRQKARISKAELCREAGVHVETLRRWRLARTSPRLATVEALQGALKRLTEGSAS